MLRILALAKGCLSGGLRNNPPVSDAHARAWSNLVEYRPDTPPPSFLIARVEQSLLPRHRPGRRLRRHRAQRPGVGLQRGLDRGADFRRDVRAAKPAEE